MNEQRARGPGAVRIAVVDSHGGGPNGHQRGMLKEFQKGAARTDVTTALSTSSALARGLGARGARAGAQDRERGHAAANTVSNVFGGVVIRVPASGPLI